MALAVGATIRLLVELGVSVAHWFGDQLLICATPLALIRFSFDNYQLGSPRARSARARRAAAARATVGVGGLCL